MLARIRASRSSRLNWGKDFLSFCCFPFRWKSRRYRIQALIFAISMRCQNIFWYQPFVLHDIQSNYSNMSARQTPPMLLLYCWTIWGHGMFFLTFSFPRHLSNSQIGSSPTKLDTRLTTLLSTHVTAIRSFENSNVNEKVNIFNTTIKNILPNYISHQTVTCNDRDPPLIYR